MAVGKETWSVTKHGDLQHTSGYFIDMWRLDEPDWLAHLYPKDWFNADEFVPVYVLACFEAERYPVYIDDLDMGTDRGYLKQRDFMQRMLHEHEHNSEFRKAIRDFQSSLANYLRA